MEPPTDLASDEVYTGVIKSYNDRRGFGFIACQETAIRFGRDVYVSKTEAQLAAAEAAGDSAAIAQILAAAQEKAEKKEEASAGTAGEAGGGSAPPAEKPPPLPRLSEEDLVHFQVRLSLEGFPQATAVQKLRKFEGAVRAPPAVEGGCAGRIASPGLAALTGEEELDVFQEGCGQVRLEAGDRVSFCVKGLLEGRPAEAGDRTAAIVSLIATERPANSVLGCFGLLLPRPPVVEGQPSTDDLRLFCHAFGDKIILAGLPPDTQESELSRFFAKQGASSIIVAHAKGCSFASVSFPSVFEVARLLGRMAHAFADDKDTRIATLLSQAEAETMEASTSGRLPALPAPLLGNGEEPGSLVVVWSPLVLAVGYTVELRPTGGGHPWAAVDVAAGVIGSGTSRFDPECSSCKVTGLIEGTMYEARVMYFASSGCRAEASDPSAPRAPLAEGAAPPAEAPAAPAASGEMDPDAPPFGPAQLDGAPYWLPPCSGGSMWAGWATDAAAADFQAAMAGAMAPPPMMPSLQALPGGAALGWRCIHGAVIPPPSAPDVRSDEHGFALTVQWPSVAQAVSYVVELQETGSASVERFFQPAKLAAPGSLVELRIGGLRPSGGPGRTYTARVRCVGIDGCESAPSDPGHSAPPPCAGAAPAQAPPPAPAPPPPLAAGLPPATPPQLPDAAARAWTPWLGAAGPYAALGSVPAVSAMPPPLVAQPPPSAPQEAPSGPPEPPAHAPTAAAAPVAPSAPAAAPSASSPPPAAPGVEASTPKEDCLILD